MYLLHIIGSMDPISGGPAQGIRTLDSQMSEMGVIREVVCLDAPDSAYLGRDKFKIHAVGPAKGRWCYSPNLVGWLKTNIPRFDVIIINGLWLYPSYAIWKVIKDLKKNHPDKRCPRLLVMSHGMLDPYFQRAKDRRLKAIRNWVYWKLIEGKVVNDADGMLFTCQTELLLARETFRPYHPKKEYNVGYGIAVPPSYSEAMTTAFNTFCPGLDGVPYFLFLSRIHPKKGVDILINAYIDLHRSINSSGGVTPKLVIAGPGINTSLGKIIQQLLLQAPDVSVDIFFPGMLKGSAKWGAFYGCEAFILPSHQENFGIAVVEALACAKPVLISNQVNIWREIMSGGGGIIEDDNLNGVQKMFKRWMSLKAEEKKQLSDNALLTYQNQFTISKFAGNFLSAFIDN